MYAGKSQAGSQLFPGQSSEVGEQGYSTPDVPHGKGFGASDAMSRKIEGLTRLGGASTYRGFWKEYCVVAS